MTEPRLGLRENIGQFSLLVLVNAFVGAMVGLERSILPAIAEHEFHLAAKAAMLSFIVVFGFSKALTNYLAGSFSDRFGRKVLLVLGWLVALPVAPLLIWAPGWNWILLANLLLGISQGLTWSTTVIMKIDLVGPERRGLAMGFNEFAGYFAVALSALVTGYLASHHGLRPAPFYLGIGYSALGLLLSFFLVRETHGHAAHESKLHAGSALTKVDQREIFLKTSFLDRDLSSITQAGFVNNLNDGMAWGLFPILFAQVGLGLEKIGWLAAVYPASWGVLQLWTGHLSDSWGRKGLIAAGMWVQAAGIAMNVLIPSPIGFALGGLLLGLGTAMVYPTLLAAIGDVAHPSWRASAVGVYRLWRDSGYAVGALVAGLTADFFGIRVAIWLVAAITLLSGVVVAVRMQETLKMKTRAKIERQKTGDSISPQEAERMLREKTAVVVDVRSSAEFTEGHIKGARHVPIEALPGELKELGGDIGIITVCNKGGGRSEQAAEFLRAQGWANSAWLEGGYFGWRDLGLPRVEVGEASS